MSHLAACALAAGFARGLLNPLRGAAWPKVAQDGLLDLPISAPRDLPDAAND